MKKIIVRCCVALLLTTGFVTVTNAQRVYVKVQPAVPHEDERPVQPSPHHVWVEGEWRVENGAYVRKPGYWTVPPAGKVWVAGHWSHESGGYYWREGHWRVR